MFGPISTQSWDAFGHIRAACNQIWADFENTGPTSTKRRPMSTNFDHTWKDIDKTRARPTLDNTRRFRQKVGRRIGRTLYDLADGRRVRRRASRKHINLRSKRKWPVQLKRPVQQCFYHEG